MKIDHIRVSRFNVAEVVKEINKRVEGRNLHSVFFEHDGLLGGTLKITSDEIKNTVMKVEVPAKREYKKSNYRGVCWDKGLCKWRARISVNGKRISLGLYDDEEKAAEVYDLQSLKSNGFNAKLNFHWRFDQNLELFRMELK